MKTIKFEKTNRKLTKEELNFIKGGDKLPVKNGTQRIGDSDNGDTWMGSAWQKDPNGDTRWIEIYTMTAQSNA